jgi:hypothetical protein
MQKWVNIGCKLTPRAWIELLPDVTGGYTLLQMSAIGRVLPLTSLKIIADERPLIGSEQS